MNTPFSLPLSDLNETLARGASVWPAFRDRRILLTGGTGFFGRWLVESLLHANDALGLGAELYLISRDPERCLSARPAWRRPDLRWSAGDVREAVLPAGPFDYLLHAATDSTPAAQRDGLGLIDQIVGGTRRLLDWASESGVQRVLYVSSGAVYGELPPGPVAEHHAGAPPAWDAGSAYGQAKRFAEHLCAQYAREGRLETVGARCFAFVGPGLALDGHFAIGNFIRDALHGCPITINSDGRSLRSYLYMADLAVWLWTLLASGRSGTAYNVGSDQAVSIAELARTVSGILAPDLQVRVLGQEQAGARSHYVPDIARARELNLDVWTPLPEAIRRTAHWSMSHNNRST